MATDRENIEMLHGEVARFRNQIALLTARLTIVEALLPDAMIDLIQKDPHQ